ncbi:MAG: hypothetical protein HY718_10590, partial [Planctomycetes bacterium]|nr:hypothetical protein [Planctomycetota bacterium]
MADSSAPARSAMLPPREGKLARGLRTFFRLRAETPLWQTVAFGVLCVAVCLGLWWFATRGEAEERLLSPAVLPSPAETFATFHSLWFDRELTRNTGASLRRLTTGFGLAALVGVPLGVLAG